MALFGALLVGAGCRDVTGALGVGRGPVGRATSAEQLFRALQARVTLPHRDAQFDSARARIGHAAFLPSRVWRDTSVWTDTSQRQRMLTVRGFFADDRYLLTSRRGAQPLVRLADSRHVIVLTRLGEGEYAWDTDVDYAVGSVSADDIGRFVEALFAGAGGRREREIRDAMRAAAPRTADVLTQLFRVDSIRTSSFPDRSTLATFTATLTPGGVEARLPAFARYLRRYGLTTRMRWTLSDGTGAIYLECSMHDGRMLLRVRSLDGHLVSLTDAARLLPDSMTLHGDFTMRIRRFTVGFRNYQAAFHIERGPRERAWKVVSTREPHWELPLFSERLLRTPLRRPFQGSGAQFRIGVRDSANAQTILHRSLHVEVQESAILRFIGRLGAIALSDYSGDAEREQYAWLKELFDALLADLGAPENQSAADR